MSRIFDAFMVGAEAELPLIEIHMEELDHVVDGFIVIEGEATFQGARKPAFFPHGYGVFGRFAHKIEYRLISADDLLKLPGPWEREWFQRNAVTETRTFLDMDENDWLVLGDADEVPRAGTVREVAESGGVTNPACYIFDQICFWYWLNCRSSRPAHCTRMCRKDMLTRFTPQRIRECQVGEAPLVPNAGWHFSFMGGVAAIQKKIASFSHAGFNQPPYNDPDNLLLAITEGVDIFGGAPEHTLRQVPVDASFPRHLVQNLDRFRHLIMPPPQTGHTQSLAGT